MDDEVNGDVNDVGRETICLRYKTFIVVPFLFFQLLKYTRKSSVLAMYYLLFKLKNLKKEFIKKNVILPTKKKNYRHI